MINRNQIIPPLVERLRTQEFVKAIWEGGAAAFNRVDEWSDIDIAVIVPDDKTKETFAIVEEELKKISTIEKLYEPAQSPWQGHEQKFYLLKNTSPFLLIDLSIFKESAPDMLLEKEIHGNSLIHYDKTGITKKFVFDELSHNKKIEKKLETLKSSFEIFDCFTEKELNRGNFIEAIGFYNAFVLRPLVELLRIKYSPEHFNFYTRYIHYELPPDAVKKLQTLFFISDPDELRSKEKTAKEWFNSLISEF